MTDMLTDTLRRIENKIDSNSAITADVRLGQAVLTERVGNLIEKTEEHIEADRQVHERHAKDIDKLKEWKTELKTKIATYAAVAGFFVMLIVEAGKEAFAALLR